jgi:anti-sigma regulatory factor (Ser/Thr protein kinase)
VIEVADKQGAFDQAAPDERRSRRRAVRLRCVGVPAVAGRLPGLRRRITDWARQAGLGPERIDALRLASDEALANVVRHAYRGGRGVVDLYASYQPERDKVTVTVVDHGRWRPALILRSRSRRFGMTLMRGLADTVDVNTGPEGTTVRLSWARACPA